MGLFSSSNKNPQDRAADDSGRFYSKDDDAAIGERARAKRASNAGGSMRRQPNDPLLPEKKRARRRLVGAVALALAVAVGLPMLLDSEPKPLAGDIAIQIPSKDKAAPLPVPGEKPVEKPAEKAADKVVAAKDSVDKGEEVMTLPPVAKAVAPAPVAPAPAKPEHKAEPTKVESRPEPKPEPKPEHKEAKPEHKDAHAAEKADKADKPAKPKPEDKPAKSHDAARALAILEDKPAAKDKPAEKAADKPAESASQRYVLQVAALSSAEKAAEVQAKLRDAGISSYTQKAATASGELIRVRVGPLGREDAEKVRAKLGKLGLSGTMTPM